MAVKLKQSPLPERIAPAQPRRHWIWTEPGQYHGAYAQEATPLLGLLHHPAQMLRLEQGGFCLIFDDPVTLDPAEVPAIPLRRAGPDSFASFETDQSPPRSVSIIAAGARKTLSLDAAEVLDPLSFWDLSQIPVMAGRAPAASNTAIPKLAKPAPENNSPQLSQELRAVSNKPEPFKDLRSHVEATSDPKAPRILKGAAIFTLRLLVSTLVILSCILILILALGSSFVVGPVSIIIAGLLIGWMFRLFRPRPLDIVDSGARGKTPPTGAQRSGFFSKLLGLTLWSTPLGNKLRRQLHAHLEQINKMIDQGDIDRALKRAMSLAQEEKAKSRRNNRLATDLPKPRANLDFDLSGISAETVTIPGDWGFDELRQKYRTLAQELSAKGDHRRAAFIYSELLGDTKHALAELEAMKAYEEAAKLATARKSNGETIARLWFLAGQKEVALLMARRHNCMDHLARISTKDPEFSAFVRSHWIKDLIAEGDLPRAVQESADNPRLAETHLHVLGLAIGEGHLRELPVLERAVQSLPWSIEALNEGPSAQHTIGGQLEQVIFDGMRQADAGELRQGLKRAVERIPGDDPRKPALADALVRASLAFDAATPYALSTTDLQRFAKAQGCTALAEDLRQIKRNGPSKALTERVIALPKSGHGAWAFVAALHKGAALVGTASGEVTYVTAQGQKRWSDHFPDLVGMVPIGVGRFVLLLQGSDIKRRITLLDTAHRTYRQLGSTKLMTWDRYAREGIWQIQTPEAIGALDLSKLLAEAPRFDMLWSITQTIPVKVIAFNSSKDKPQWITQRIEPHGPGIIELWSLTRVVMNLTVNLESPSTGGQLTKSTHIWRKQAFVPALWDTAPDRALDFGGTLSDLATEQKLTAELGKELLERSAFADIIPAPGNTAYAVKLTTSAPPQVTLLHENADTIAQLNGHSLLTQSGSADGEHLVIATQTGLLMLCDFKSMSVSYL